jgi:ribosomal protein L11 methyltransferase
VRAPAAEGERVLAALLELAPAGLEQVDGDGWVEFALYGAPGELPVFPRGPAEVGGVRVTVAGTEVAGDWAERWREFHRPVLVARRIWVRPPWVEARAGALDLVIDPAQAFGTGAHPTTRLSLELLLGLERRSALSDVGCGSGVLAIAAARLGFEPVFALDNDLAAVDATLANARANGVELARVERLDLRSAELPPAPAMTANLVRPLLLELARRLPPGTDTLIAAGLLEGEEDEVANAFEGLREHRRLRLEGWSALLLSR